MLKYFAVKNFEKYQHYKDRNPPWIKLHRTLLSDYEFTKLEDYQKGQLMLIWLLSSQTDNKIPQDAEWVANQIRSSHPRRRCGYQVDVAEPQAKRGSDQGEAPTRLSHSLQPVGEGDPQQERETDGGHHQPL